MNDTEDENKIVECTIYEWSESVTVRNYKVPKQKLVDLEWIMNKWNSDSKFVNFCNDFKKILTKAGIKDSINVYPASYGIGIFIMYGRRERISEIKIKIDTILNDLGIEFRNEYSEASWVFRYKISKKAENIERLGKI
jgi:hypothetical protein